MSLFEKPGHCHFLYMSSAEELNALKASIIKFKANPDANEAALVDALDKLLDGTHTDEAVFKVISVFLKKIIDATKKDTIKTKATALKEKYDGGSSKKTISRTNSVEDPDLRDQKRRVIRKVLKEHGMDENTAIKIANEIEDEVNATKQGEDYNQHILYILTTIDKKDEHFKIVDKLKSGALTPAKFVNASREEFLTEEEKEEAKMIAAEAAHGISVPLPKRTASGVFTCPKCKSKNTTFTQVQTRGGDEPMTNMVECLDCGLHFRR